MSFAVVKRSLGLAYLRLTHQNGILIQIWCALAVYQILQDLRLDIAVANDWNEDEVSWEMLMRRIDLYSHLCPASPLRDWLVQEGARLFLKKRGCRHRCPISRPSRRANRGRVITDAAGRPRGLRSWPR